MGTGIPWESTGMGINTEMGMGMGGNGKLVQWEWELPALPGKAFRWEYITYSRKRTSIDVLHN